MFKHFYVNSDLEVMLECDVCHKIVESLDQAECIFPDARLGQSIRPIIGHTKCTFQYDQSTGFVYPNNISMRDYLSRVGEKGGGYGMFMRERGG